LRLSGHPEVPSFVRKEQCAENRGAATPAGALSGRNALSAWPRATTNIAGEAPARISLQRRVDQAEYCF